ncbi:MAG: DNA mismatch repair protein MutS [Dysgonamonadaceae bacterium]|nr:DNA mismatch repair protein MutS [Dysgonamonadaceae bacterium]
MKFEELKTFYNQRVGSNQKELTKLKKHIYLLGTARLIVVLIAIALLFLFWENINFPIYVALLLCFFAFLRMVLRNKKLNEKKDYLKTALSSDRDELRAIDYDFSAYDGAPERISSTHPFSLDLDLFGTRSFFQSLNRTVTPKGKEVLIEWIENPLPEKNQILSRQETIKELSLHPSLIHHFEVTGRLTPGTPRDTGGLNCFVERPSQFNNKRYWHVLSYLFPILWIIVTILAGIGVIPFSVLTLFYILTFGISESCFKKVNDLQEQIGKKMKILGNYSDLIKIIESCDLRSKEAGKIKRSFLNDGFSVSDEIRRLARLSGELEQRANMLVHLVLNPVLLWDVRKAIAIEKWKDKNKTGLQLWLLKLGEFDAYCSWSKFAFNHPDYVYPEISDSYFEMEGKELGHPLLHRQVCVKNSIDLSSSPQFMVVTGANMAGKSTYLRTVGINYLLACIGAPVFSSFLRVYPAYLYTSLRTSDSLNDNESYFYAELRRLKAIIDELDRGRKIFIILDEILKGTNSIDKQKGSFALLKQFINLETCGIIATHDLALGSLEKEFPEYVRNYHFDADIINDELHFSYRLRDGVAQNMNASFLMKKMGITL